MTLDKNIIGREILTAIEAAKSDYKTLAPIELWVDASTGNDANDGSESAPLASLVEAERRLPIVIDHDVLIHVAPHTGLGYAPPTFRERIMRANIDVVAMENGVLSETVLYSGVAQTGTLHTGLVAEPGLGVDTYRGKTVVMTSGTQVDYRRTIAVNTDTVITPCCLWQSAATVATTIVEGDTFEIVEPSTTIYVSATDEYAPHTSGTSIKWFITQGDSPVQLYSVAGGHQEQYAVNFVNFVFASAASSVLVLEGGCPVRLFGCSTPASLSMRGGAFAVGIDGTRGDFYSELAQVGYRTLQVTREAWAGWGLMCGAGLSVSRVTSSHLFGIVATRAIFYQCLTATVSGCNLHTLGATVYGDARSPGHVHFYGKMYLPDNNQRITNTTGHAITVQGLGAVVEVDETTLTAGGTGAGVYATQGAQALVNATVTVVAPVGAKAIYGSRIQFRAGALTVTATGNELEAGNTPTASTVAALATAGAYISEADGSVIQRVA